MPNSSSRGCHELIENSKVMTIAVCDEDGAWSAPVYYVLKDHWFYFFSNPDARHIKKANNQISSASIFRDDPCFSNLQGIQMSGNIQKASLDAKALAIAKKYCTRFKIKANDVGILAFFCRIFKICRSVLSIFNFFYIL